MNYSLYVHIPFCKQRCHYCDFNTYAGEESLIPDYVFSLMNEFRIVSEQLSGIGLHSIYFGGGTPTLISALHYQQLMEVIFRQFSISQDCEISLEANPGTISLTYLKQLRDIGFNRVSIGVQSTDPFDLARLDRIHSVNDVLESFHFARQAGFDNVNFDLMFDLPWQNLFSWVNSLKRIITIHPEHLSLYSLIIEPGTPLFHWYQRGLIAKQDEDVEAEMYESAINTLENAGYHHYEISNWAKENPDRDFRCRHNLQYWLNLPYIGIGAGAHGYLKGIRTENVRTIREYIGRLSGINENRINFPATPATCLTSEVDQITQMKDFILLGLRLVDQGVSSVRFYQTYQCSMAETFADEINELIDLSLVEWIDEKKSRLKLSKRGILLANQAFMRFV